MPRLITLPDGKTKRVSDRRYRGLMRDLAECDQRQAEWRDKREAAMQRFVEAQELHEQNMERIMQEKQPHWEQWGSNASFVAGLVLLCAFGVALFWVLSQGANQ